MDQLIQTLPEPLKSFVDNEVSAGKYPDATAFVIELISAERKKRLMDKVESLVQEACDSGEATPWSQTDWDFIRAEVRSRLARRPGIKT